MINVKIAFTEMNISKTPNAKGLILLRYKDKEIGHQFSDNINKDLLEYFNDDKSKDQIAFFSFQVTKFSEELYNQLVSGSDK